MLTRTIVPDAFAGMNKLEKGFALTLEARKRAGEIAQWEFERITLKLAFDTRYTPDFFAVRSDGLIEFYETKGFMRDDARAKLNVAARLFPFQFYLVRGSGGSFTVEAVKP